MGILVKLKNANSDISVIIGDFKNLLSIFSVKIARLISFTTLASLLATRMYFMASNLTRRLWSWTYDEQKVADLSVFLEEKDRALNQCSP